MKQNHKSLLLALLVFFAILAGTAGGSLWLNGTSRSIENGSVLPGPLENELYLLHGIEEAGGNSYRFSAVMPVGEEGYALLLNNRECVIYCNGELLYQGEQGRQPPSFEVVAIPGAAESGMVRIEFEFVTEDWENSVNLYLTTAKTAFRYQAYFYLLYAFGLGVFFIVAVCAALLYRYKPSESYLAWFALHAAMLTLWSVLSLPVGEIASKTQWLTGHMYSWTTVLNVLACYKIFEKKAPDLLRRLFSTAGILLTFAFFTLGDMLLPSFAMQLVRHGYLLLGCGIALWGCWQREREGYFLLVGMALSQGVRLVLLFGNFPQFPLSFWLMALRYAKIINITFAIAYMVAICRTFALKFGEAEKLAGELEQANRSLDKKVEERTLALQEEQRQRRAFMLNIFHDLRTPLFILKGGLDSIAREERPDKGTIDAMRSRLDFAAGLTEDLFLTAKLEEHKVLMETEVVAFCQLVGRVTKASAITCREKGVELNVSIQKGMRVFGDERYLEQAVQNIVTNAVEYAGKGGSVWVKVAREGEAVVASVRDSGPGIPHEELPLIFQRYYTAHNARESSSTGLGLSIAREIVREHRGHIEVTSEVGKGTEFRIFLPALETGTGG